MSGSSAPSAPSSGRRLRRQSQALPALNFTAGLYSKWIRDREAGQAAREYLAARGFSDVGWLVEQGVGFARGFGVAAAWRRAAGGGEETAQDLVVGGVLVESLSKEEPHRTWEFMRNRITFAIRRPGGTLGPRGNGEPWETVGFGGRRLGEEGPKYLNTHETPHFDKGGLLYGMEWAAPAIRDTKQVVVVEGFMDVLRCRQLGIGGVVAPLGTALTEAQIALVHKCAYNEGPVDWYICLDADAAGARAAYRNALVILRNLRPGGSVRLMRLPGGKDPDEALLAAGEEAHSVWSQAKADSRSAIGIALEGAEQEGKWDQGPDTFLAALRRASQAIDQASPGVRDRLREDLYQELRTAGFEPSPYRLQSALESGVDRVPATSTPTEKPEP